MAEHNPEVNPEVPSVLPKAGWTTSQGQLTAVFTFVCMILSLFGFAYTPEQLIDWADRIEAIAAVIVPLLVAIFPLMSYITSRGKIQSNTINANAAIKMQALAPPPNEGMLMPLISGDRIGDAIGGDDWKDPERYSRLITIARDIGVPGADRVDAINRQLKPADLITGILGILKNKSN